ncbi:MAG: ATP-binding cassette domain-containing protein [Actinomycetales bacterium]|nr:ATP-binding cassette domain-containing protein [Actinomycetales bacterium]
MTVVGEHAAYAIQTWGLTKRFGSQTVVDGIDLAVPEGAVFGFLGPNGSGKTTTIRMVLGLIQPTAGRSHILATDVSRWGDAALHRVGALVEGPAFHPYLSGRANLARLDVADRRADPRTSRVRVDAALDRVGLLAAAGKRYRAYSPGMRQRLAIAAALLMPRELLVLDEPTNGLDPQGTREVRSLIASLGADGATVLVSSHLLSEVEQICTHLGVMREGRLVAQGPLAELRGGASLAVLHTTDSQAAARVLAELGATAVTVEPATNPAIVDAAVSTVRADLGTLEPEKAVAALVHAGVGVRGFQCGAQDLEDWFVALTGEGFDVSG